MDGLIEYLRVQIWEMMSEKMMKLAYLEKRFYFDFFNDFFIQVQ
jgi:hypothetical protein